MQNNLFKKSFAVGIIILFTLVGISPATGITISLEDTTPPVTTIRFYGQEGENDWFVNVVEVKLTATDDLSGVNVSYYQVNGNGWQIYDENLWFTESGHYLIEYYSIDNAGNVEEVKSATFKMDMKAPSGLVTYKYVGFSKIKFTVDAYDETSGVVRVEFYWYDELQYIDYEPPYEWVLVISTSPVTWKATIYPFYVYDEAGWMNEAIGSNPVNKVRFLEQFPLLNLLLQRLRI